MGRSYTPVKQNKLNLEKAYNLLVLQNYEVIETTNEKYFNTFPSFKNVKEIEICEEEPRVAIRLKNDDFVIINAILTIDEVRK